jgi:hypothetical protein
MSKPMNIRTMMTTMRLSGKTIGSVSWRAAAEENKRYEKAVAASLGARQQKKIKDMKRLLQHHSTSRTA